MEKIKKLPIIIIMIIVMLTTVTLAVSGTVNAPSGLVLREEPSRTSNPITTVPDDATVEVIEESGEWYKVTYNGQEGYLFAEYVEGVEEINTPSTETQENPDAENQNQENTNTNNMQTQSEIKIYMMPLVTSTPIGTIAQGTSVTVIKEITNWSYVTDGINEGWVRTYAINEGTTAPENTQNPVQEQPTEETPTQPEEQTPAETPTEPEEQTPVETPTEPEEQTPTQTETTVTRGVVNVGAANVRKEASTSSEIVTTLTRDTDVEITAESGEWYKVIYTDVDGTIYEGYMLKTLLQAN